jgi:hypothetical protein
VISFTDASSGEGKCFFVEEILEDLQILDKREVDLVNVGKWKRKQTKLKIVTPFLPELQMKNCEKEKKKED